MNTAPTGPAAPGVLDIALITGPTEVGQTAHLTCLAGALADRGHRVTFYTRRATPELPDRWPLRDGVGVHLVPTGPPEQLHEAELLPHAIEFGHRLARIWRRRPPDLIHSHSWIWGPAALRAARQHGLPLLHTYHALGTIERRHHHVTDMGLACDRIIATCRNEVAELTRMGVPAEKTTVVPYGVDPDRFTPHGPKAPRGAHPYRLLQVGKGAAVSIAALPLLPGAELVVVGGPPPCPPDRNDEVRRLRALAHEAGVAHRVHFTGGVPDDRVPPLLRSADVVVCPADHEPFGTVPLEAMACGRPVVAGAVGSHLDMVADPGTGRLVPPRDPEALARAVGALLADPATREACGAAARRRILARYTWAQVAAATETAYCETLDAEWAATGTS